MRHDGDEAQATVGQGTKPRGRDAVQEQGTATKFAELLVKGIPKTYEEWNRSTGRVELPERVKPKPGRKAKKGKKKAVKSKSKPKTKRRTS